MRLGVRRFKSSSRFKVNCTLLNPFISIAGRFRFISSINKYILLLFIYMPEASKIYLFLFYNEPPELLNLM